MIDDVDAPDGVETPGSEWHFEQVGLQNPNGRRAAAASGRHMGCRQIDADHRPMGLDLAQQPCERLAGTATRIEHAHSGPQLQAGDGLTKFGLGEGIEKPQLERIVASAGIAQQADGRGAWPGVRDHNVCASAARTRVTAPLQAWHAARAWSQGGLAEMSANARCADPARVWTIDCRPPNLG